MTGYDSLWFLGDNFMASTYRWSFKKNKNKEFYIKEYFEVFPFCQSKYENADTNMLNRLRNSLLQGINEKSKLPKYIIVLLDDDLIEYLGYAGQGVSALLGDCVEWLCKEFTNLIDLAKSCLPTKASKTGYPQIYWVAPPHHANFDNNQARTKITNVLENVLVQYKDIRMIRMKEIWNYNNSNFVNELGQYTDEGWDQYWASVDAAVKFNIAKRELYLANQLRNASRNAGKRPHADEMTRFFKKKKIENKNSCSPVNDNKARKLPTPRK